MPPVNQQSIADMLQISRTTVSRCFTNHKGINPVTRSEVFALAARLGYRYLQPRSASPSSPKMHSIGVLISSESGSTDFPAAHSPDTEMLPGVSEFAQLNRLQADVHFVPPTAAGMTDPAFALIDGLRTRAWSGLILIKAFSPRFVREVATAFPCVSLAEPYDQVALDCVTVNHHLGVAAVMDRLRANGHVRIGFFSRRGRADTSYRRFSAYLATLIRHGIPCHDQDVVHFDGTSPEVMNGAYRRVAEQTRDGVTAWVCAADEQAYDLIAALQDHGFEVPRDVSVSGFDGIARPPGALLLDTVAVPYYEIGFAGSRRLFDKINKRFDTAQEILVEGHLREGETIGPCPRGKRPAA